MARMPGAQWRPLPGSSTTKISSYDILAWHTMVGSLAGTDSYFRGSAAGTNSHFGVGHDGTIYQWVDTAYRSGANLNGNYHIISVETADTGTGFPAWTGSNVPAWNAAQIEANAQIAAWVNKTHGIPFDLIPDAKPGRRGNGWHRQGVPGYMVAGAEKWSNATGKVCPGDRRIAQIPQVIARAKQIAGGQTAPTEEDMLSALTPDEQRRVLAAADLLLYMLPQVKDIVVGHDQRQEGYGRRIENTEAQVTAVNASQQAVAEALRNGSGLDAAQAVAAGQAGAEAALVKLGKELTGE